MSYELTLILGFSIVIPAILALFRYNRSTSDYHPFFFLIWIGLLNDILSASLIHRGHSNAVNSNIYVLIESLLILIQFRKWKLFNKYNLFFALVFLYVGVWVTESFLISTVYDFNPFFGILYSFVTVLMSIQVVNQLIVKEQRSISRHPAFIISIGFIIFYTYKIIVEIFWLYGLDNSPEFQSNIYSILSVINFICNLIYALAIIWIRKQVFFRPS